ncbi:MAG: 3-beta hydroxysteroid dehydrogenase, partial [Deltaproteobacteria bacterium]
TRLEPAEDQVVPGVSRDGFSEGLPMDGARSLYGATKLCSEILIQEYVDAYGLQAVINRCGVITGPWQMGKVDQGFVVLWMARHLWGGELSYIGFGGKGKQVRDILHVEDLYDLVAYQLDHMEDLSGSVFNVGGGPDRSISLLELTGMCRRLTGNEISIQSQAQDRAADIPYYVSDCRKVREATGWRPKRDLERILADTLAWLRENEKDLRPLLGPEAASNGGGEAG